MDVNAPEVDGTTALHWAVHRGDLDLAQRLIRAGAKVNVKNEYGSTPMSEAAVLGRADLLEALLKAGADVESPNADGQTALMVVARTSQVDAAQAAAQTRREGERGRAVARPDGADVGGGAEAAGHGRRARRRPAPTSTRVRR